MEILIMLLKVFVVGGLICVVGQLLMDKLKLTPAHTMCVLVVSGAVLSAFGLYQPLVEFAGAGASTPISSFGNSLTIAATEGAAEGGFWGILGNLYTGTSAGIGAAVVFGFIAALFFKPKG